MPRKAAKAKDQPTIPPAGEPTTTPEHSSLGASGAERWMNCPGSHNLINALDLPETDEPEYRAQGTAAHAAAAAVLTKGLETWEIVGQTFEGVTITAEMGMYLDEYIQFARPLMEARQTYGVEFRISAPDVHPLFYGTADLWALAETYTDWTGIDPALAGKNALHVVDLKFGMGVVVEVEDNPQLKYYAYGVIDVLETQRSYQFADDMPVVLTICQPRAFHPEGTRRSWPTTVGEIKAWVHSELRPAMANAEIDGTLTPGEWCRFCPAKLACPMLQGLFDALCKVDPSHVRNWSDASLDRSYALLDGAKQAAKAIEEEAFKRALAGTKFDSAKVVNKKANRVWKPEALDAVTTEFGDAAYEPRALKTPPNIEALGPRGKALVKQHAFTPFTGFSLAKRSDQREEVRPPTGSETFQKALDAVLNDG